MAERHIKAIEQHPEKLTAGQVVFWESETVPHGRCPPFALEQAGDKSEPLVHDVTLLPRHRPLL